MTTSIGIQPLSDSVFVYIYDDGGVPVKVGDKLIYLPTDSEVNLHDRSVVDRPHRGGRARWAVILATGKKAEEDGLKIGDKVLCAKGEWSRAVVYNNSTYARFWRISVDHIVMVDEEGLNECERVYVKGKLPWEVE